MKNIISKRQQLDNEYISKRQQLLKTTNKKKYTFIIRLITVRRNGG